MSEGRYVEEVYRRVCAMESDGTNALGDVMKIANDVASEHPLQYERFRMERFRDCLEGCDGRRTEHTEFSER